jgi:hypothetical protein
MQRPMPHLMLHLQPVRSSLLNSMLRLTLLAQKQPRRMLHRMRPQAQSPPSQDWWPGRHRHMRPAPG